MRQPLIPHRDTPCRILQRVEASIGEDASGALRVHFRMLGRTDRIAMTPLAPGVQPQRRDGLWRHTCCELFVRDRNGDGYVEYNFAPSGDWAAYRFSGYRAGMVPLETNPFHIVVERSAAVLTLTVTLRDLSLDTLRGQRIGIASVVETRTELSYWALAHPPGAPDFHHPSSFAMAVEPERRATPTG